MLSNAVLAAFVLVATIL
ncbi:hypothetical protein KIPB_012221, partial [Kipferlia bialata]|eukprot:g12221.t1